MSLTFADFYNALCGWLFILTQDGYTALQLGTKHGHKEITQLLLTYGADINGNREVSS